jgi:hypothetical protein
MLGLFGFPQMIIQIDLNSYSSVGEVNQVNPSKVDLAFRFDVAILGISSAS